MAMRRSFALALAGLAAAGIALVAAAPAVAGADDRAVAEQMVRDLGAGGDAGALTDEPLVRAKAALERATRLRQAGDEPHARLADGVAREWAEMARDLVRTSESEERAAGKHCADST